jgi:uncharacterized membrane protein YcjF (UPF0283 family)
MVDEAENATSGAEFEPAEVTETDAVDVPQRRLSLIEKIVVGLCGVGVVAATIIALEYSGISIVGHTADVLSENWTQEATIGVTVALVVAVIVGFFIWLGARATVDNPSDDAIEEAYTPDLIPE